MKNLARCILIVVLAFPLKAQDSPAPFVMSVNSDFMELHVSVVDEKDRNVGGLTIENFKVKENGIPQPITIFKHEDIPVSLGLVIDNSRSIEPRKTRLDAATLAFVRQSHPDDESFVVHFDFDARVERDFTTKISDLEETLAARGVRGAARSRGGGEERHDRRIASAPARTFTDSRREG